MCDGMADLKSSTRRLERLPVALSSAEWYGGKLQHLPMAWIQTPRTAPSETAAVNPLQAILVFVLWRPGAIFGLFGAAVAAGLAFQLNASLSWITGLTFSSCTSGVAALVWKITSGASSITGHLRQLVRGGTYHFPLVLMVDRLSVAFLAYSGGVIRTDRAVLGDLPSS